MSNFHHRLVQLLILQLLLLSLTGCAQIRKLTYPQDFTYLSQQEVEAQMREMSNTIQRLGEYLSPPVSADDQLQKTILAELDVLERIAARLAGRQRETNRPDISEHIQQFMGDIDAAQLYAGKQPPDYTPAGNLVSSCLSCHKQRQ